MHAVVRKKVPWLIWIWYSCYYEHCEVPYVINLFKEDFWRCIFSRCLIKYSLFVLPFYLLYLKDNSFNSRTSGQLGILHRMRWKWLKYWHKKKPFKCSSFPGRCRKITNIGGEMPCRWFFWCCGHTQKVSVLNKYGGPGDEAHRSFRNIRKNSLNYGMAWPY